MKSNFGNNSPVLNLYNKSNLKSKIDTQLLYGDNFRVIKKNKRWKKIIITKDGYKGFIKNKKFPFPIKANFKVFILKANLYSKPSIKNKTSKYLSFNSRLNIIEKKR